MKNHFRIAFAYLFLFTSCCFATVTTDNIKYGTSTTITCTFNSLASSATAGRSSAAIDNSSNLFVDAFVTVISSTGAGTQANDKAIYVYLYGSEDGTNYDVEEGTGTVNIGFDQVFTINSPTLFKGPVVIPVLTGGRQYVKTFSVAQFWNGVMPKKWGILIINFTGQTLGVSGNSASYTGVTYTNQ